MAVATKVLDNYNYSGCNITLVNEGGISNSQLSKFKLIATKNGNRLESTINSDQDSIYLEVIRKIKSLG